VTAASLAAVRRGPLALSPRVRLGLLGAVAVVLYVAFRGQDTLPHANRTDLFEAINDFRSWFGANRETIGAPFALIRNAIAALVDGLIGGLSWLGWPGVIGLGAALGYMVSGLRIAAIVVIGFAVLGALGLWEESIETLGLTLAAVLVSLLIGVPIGILAGRIDPLHRFLGPLLDAAQIMPTFAYLAPMVFLFGIGSASAAIATVIYAMPATIRITSLAIRGVPHATVEAATAIGATRWQLLRKVQLPLASRVIGLAVNQTIMLALGMVVITVLIDAPGLGVPILRALQTVNVGAGFDAGLAIVVLAIMLDRLTEQLSVRMDSRRHLSEAQRARRRLLRLAALGIAVAGVIGSRLVPDAAQFPAVADLSFAAPINELTAWIKTNLFVITTGLKDAVTLWFLNPLEGILTSAPWWLVVGVTAAIAAHVSGFRAAAIAAACLVLIVALQLWQHGMETLASVLVAAAVTLALGIAIGIASARSDRTRSILRPTLDFAQTMPSFVYLLPAVALFGASRFTAIVAAVIYAAPPVIRLVDAGIRGVPAPVLEAARSSGATAGQLLLKVQLPIARPALLVAANQGIVMVLAMVVVGGLVGAGALGYDVVVGFSQRNDFGRGFAAAICIVLLGIMLDRVTQGAGRRRMGTDELEARGEIRAAAA
jgi:glycine betaine/proline transport system permease protein